MPSPHNPAHGRRDANPNLTLAHQPAVISPRGLRPIVTQTIEVDAGLPSYKGS